jgi:hypothetical protein
MPTPASHRPALEAIIQDLGRISTALATAANQIPVDRPAPRGLIDQARYRLAIQAGLLRRIAETPDSEGE